MEDNLVYWAWLQCVLGPGSERASKLIAHFKGPKQVYEQMEDTRPFVTNKEFEAM